MRERQGRMSRRTEFLIGVALVAVGALGALVVAPWADLGWVRLTGILVGVAGALVVLGMLMPDRQRAGTRVWQNELPPTGGGGMGGGGMGGL